MKQLLFFLFTMQLLSVKGQGVIGETRNALIEAYDLSGKRIPLGDQVEPEGNKMLNDQFGVGTVKFIGKQTNYHLLVNFSLLDNELFFKKDSMVLAFLNPVDSFSLTAKNQGIEKTMNFKSGYPDIAGNTERSFYQVLAGGPRVQLLKYLYKVKQDKYRYGGPIEKEYADRAKYFIYDVKDKVMYEIGKSSKSVKKTLPVYTASVDQFTTQNKIKNEDDVIALVSFINTDIASK